MSDRRWVKLDEEFFEDSKVIDAGPVAALLYVAALCWTKRTGRDGAVPRAKVKLLLDWDELGANPLEVAEKLVRVGLWDEEGENGYRVHNYGAWQRGSARIEERKRELARERQRRYRERQRAGRAATSRGHASRNASQVTESGPQSTERVKGRRTPSVSSSEDEKGVTLNGHLPQPEIERLCTLLADEIAATGGRRPNPDSKRWHDACRLLIDKDGATVPQVEYVIRWSQRDEFWRQNILSMPKVRDKWDQLVRRIEAQQKQKGRPAVGSAKASAQMERQRRRMERLSSADDGEEPW